MDTVKRVCAYRLAHPFLFWCGGGIVFFILLFLLCGAVLFSPLGNKLVLSYLQTEMQKASIPLKIQSLSLTPLSIQADLATIHTTQKENFLEHFVDTREHTENDAIALPLLPLSLKVEGRHFFFLNDIHLQITGFFDRALSQAHYKLAEDFFVRASVVGDWADLLTQGESNFLGGEWKFSLQSQKDRLTYAKVLGNGVFLLDILLFFDKPPFANGDVEVDIELQRQEQEGLVGKIQAALQNVSVDAHALPKDYGLKSNLAGFNATLKGELYDQALHYEILGNSENISLAVNGTSALKTYTTNAKYLAQVKDLSPLSPLASFPLGGAFSCNGEFKGDWKHFLSSGNSRLGNSAFSYEIVGYDSSINAFKIHSSKALMQDLLNAVQIPPYLNGDIALNADLRDLGDGGAGNITLYADSLVINSPLLEEKIALGVPATRFLVDLQTTLDSGMGLANAQIQSSLVDINASKIELDLKPFNLKIPFSAQIPRLQNFSFDGKSVISGNASVNGLYEFRGATLSMVADVLDKTSRLKVSLEDQQWQMDFSHLNVATFYNLVDLPQGIEGFFSGKIRYDTPQRQGRAEGNITQLSLLQSPYLRAMAKYTNPDSFRDSYLSLNASFGEKQSVNTLQLCKNNNAVKCEPYLTMPHFNLTEQKGRTHISGNINLYDSKKSQFRVSGEWKSPKIAPLKK